MSKHDLPGSGRWYGWAALAVALAVAQLAIAVAAGAAPAGAVAGRAARAEVVPHFGNGNAAWDAYYRDPGNTATWGPFCAGGGGSVKASALGIPACGPTGSTPVYLEGGSYTPGFQCVELSERYLYVARGWTSLSANGAQVAEVYSAKHGARLVRNGTAGVAPHVGDVMSFSNTSNFSDTGHTGVVTSANINSSGSGTIQLLSENVLETGNLSTFSVTDWTVARVFGFAYSEWAQSGNGQTAAPEIAFQANTGSLYTAGASVANHGLGMMKATSPSITVLGGSDEIAFQANTGSLWTTGAAGTKNWSLPMAAGTSPAVTALGSSFEVAFHGSDGDLWTAGADGTKNWGLPMASGTSPAIAAVGSTFEVAYQATSTSLATAGTAGSKSWGLGMMAGTSPAIAAVGSSFELAFQANTGALYSAGEAGTKNWALGMMKGTSPAVTAVGSSFELAFQANTGSLWTAGEAGTKNWDLGMMKGTSPALGNDGGAFEVSFQANTGSLYSEGIVGKNWGLGMMAGTSPSVAG